MMFELEDLRRKIAQASHDIRLLEACRDEKRRQELLKECREWLEKLKQAERTGKW